MTTRPEQQLSEIQKRNIDAVMRLAQLSIENSQRIMALQVDTAKSLFEQSVENARALTEAKDPKSALDLRTDYARAATEKMVDCARQIAQIASETQAEFAQMVSQQFSGGTKDVMEAVKQVFSFNPAAAQAAQTAMGSLQQAMDMARGAYDQLSKVSTETMTNLGATVAKAASGATKQK